MAVIFAVTAVLCLGMSGAAFAKTKKSVRSITISGLSSGCVMETGSSRKLKVKIRPAKAASGQKVIWKTSDKNVAAVSADGRVSAKKKGTSYIYAVCGRKKSNKIKIIVGTPVSKISVSGNYSKLLKGHSLKLKASVNPSNASTASVKWTSSNRSVATVSSKGVVKGISSGTATIRAVSKDGNNVTGKYKLKVSTLKSSSVRFIAHRGLSSEAPENTAAAFELAGASGFWGAECDVWETLPEVPGDSSTTSFAVSHDNTLSRIYGVSGKITQSTAAELKTLTALAGRNVSDFPGQRLPFIEDYLDICRSYGLHPVIEIKGESMSSDSVLRLLKTADSYVQLKDVEFTSFYASELDKVKAAAAQIGSSVLTDYLYSSSHSNDDGVSSANSAIDLAAKKGYTAVTVSSSLIDGKLMDHASKKGVNVACGTTNSRSTVFNLLQKYKLWSVTTNEAMFD